MWMRVPGWQIALAIVLLILMVLALAVLGGTARATDCLSLPWYRLLGCSIGTYESLSGGLIAAGGALFAGWLAWSAVREQLAIVQEQLSMLADFPIFRKKKMGTRHSLARERNSEIQQPFRPTWRWGGPCVWLGDAFLNVRSPQAPTGSRIIPVIDIRRFVDQRGGDVRVPN
jgi:hypothetical protein